MRDQKARQTLGVPFATLLGQFLSFFLSLMSPCKCSCVCGRCSSEREVRILVCLTRLRLFKVTVLKKCQQATLLHTASCFTDNLVSVMTLQNPILKGVTLAGALKYLLAPRTVVVEDQGPARALTAWVKRGCIALQIIHLLCLKETKFMSGIGCVGQV